MEDQKYRIRVCLLYDFKQGKSVRESHSSILKVFGEAAYSEEACKKWFQRFREGDETLQDRGRGHPPPALNDDDLREAIEDDPTLSTRELATMFAVGHTTIADHLHQLGNLFFNKRVFSFRTT